MRRREFITLVGGLFAWPVAAYAQQRQPQLVGILSQDLQPGLLETFRDELRGRPAASRSSILIFCPST